MSHPIASVRWLAARLGAHGRGLARAQVILIDSPMPVCPVGPGTQVVVDAPLLGRSRVRENP
jgi:2-keto-4-pentenoate hydratase